MRVESIVDVSKSVPLAIFPSIPGEPIALLSARMLVLSLPNWAWGSVEASSGIGGVFPMVGIGSRYCEISFNGGVIRASIAEEGSVPRLSVGSRMSW